MTLLRKLSNLIRRPQKESDLAEELQFHLEEEGLPPAAARRELGNLTLIAEDTRAAWGWLFLDQLAQDIRYALRAMAANKAFTALAALSLALGIGANTAIYSFMDAIMLRALPVQDPASLAVLNWHARADSRRARNSFVMHSASGTTYGDKNKQEAGIFPYLAFDRLRQDDADFSSLFAFYRSGKLNFMYGGQAELTTGEYVSGNYFRALAVPPAAGRLLLNDDDSTAAPTVVVLGSGLAQRRFGSAAAAVGQTVLINNHPFTVVGVTPPGFFGVDPSVNPQYYLPLHTNLLLSSAWDLGENAYLDANNYWLQIMGRLQPGVTLAQAQARVAPIFGQWVAGTATTDRERANLPVLQLSEGGSGIDSLRRKYSRPLLVLLTMVGLILAIACANTANLLLARAAARRREMAVRLSLGAGRFRVIRQLLTESLLLASAGGALGLLFGLWGMRVLTVLLANGNENFTIHAELNWHVLAATLAISLLCGTLFGLAPAIQATRATVIPALKQARAGDRVRHLSLGRTLVVAQISISLLMLVAAGLFVRTLSNLESVQLGFNRENVLLFELNAHQAGRSNAEAAGFYADLRKQFESVPGIRGATLSHLSLIGAGRSMPILVDGVQTPDTRMLNTGPAFFTTMQIPILLGREINDRDQPNSRPVVVVNDLFAKSFLSGQNPLGHRITLGGDKPREMEIVGVSANIHYGPLKRSMPPVVFVPYNQGDVPPLLQMTYALRTTGDPLTYVKTVRQIVHQADARVPVTEVNTQAAEIDQDINQEIIFARLCTGFAALALTIACVGLFATMSYTVARRTGEIGIRMALGAQRPTVIWMVLREVLALAAIGLAISVPAALAGSKLIESFLFRVQHNDLTALTAAAATLLAAALLAAWLPARKAARIDPMTALRNE